MVCCTQLNHYGYRRSTSRNIFDGQLLGNREKFCQDDWKNWNIVFLWPLKKLKHCDSLTFCQEAPQGMSQLLLRSCQLAFIFKEEYKVSSFPFISILERMATILDCDTEVPVLEDLILNAKSRESGSVSLLTVDIWTQNLVDSWTESV